MEMENGGLILRWSKLTDHALEPVRARENAAGYDLSSAYDLMVPARGSAMMRTDLQVQMPRGFCGHIFSRFSALNNGITVGQDVVVNADFRDNLEVMLFNHSEQDFEVKRGDCIVQLVIGAADAQI
ncbi:uncharacterized protein LOC106087103 [Stomoxys calcitrans]|uniref:uncharacterized protein LOC106087103 n=1 Tax=Stomoxys calcitrans TaxID=35570 RepID=UPI0027E35FDE|nr:uncharacterized protein LOC106087103 [Stomoxys calcitrans]